MAKKKTDRFSVVKAVKENARERVGTPPPSTPIPDRRHKAEHGPEKHKGRLRERLQRLAEGQEPGEWAGTYGFLMPGGPPGPVV